MLHSQIATEFLPTQRASEMKFGTQITRTGVRFRLWASRCDSVGLKLNGEDAPRPMLPQPRGWFELEVEGAEQGTRYQPEDVLGPSEVIDPRSYPWQDVGWVGRPWEDVVIYELHVGTFTPEGTFRAAMEKLDHLATLGVTAIELMPVNDFPGRWNWGYDGALQFAPDSRYGHPNDLKALVDAAHARGLMVFLDVVYNHFGPKGNFLPHYTPVLTERHSTPWGDAINFDGAGSEMVRDLILANARYWLIEFHFDGLRLDAVHEIKDEGFNHMLHDLALLVRGATDGRYTHLMVEDEFNDPEWLRRTGDLRAGLYDAQWNDDVHHLVDIALYGDASSYAADYAIHPDWLPRALATGFGFQGETVPTKQAPKGGPSADLPPLAFIDFLQNHDQIGNRPFGERIGMLAPPHKVRAAAALYLLSPHIPMLFMGEEWGAKTPFLFFSDVDPAFADDIRNSREEMFGHLVHEDNQKKTLPDPMAESTFTSSRLDWSEPEQDGHRDMLAHYTRLLDCRRREIVPHLTGAGGNAGDGRMLQGKAFAVEWTLGDGAVLRLLANLANVPAAGAEEAGRRIWLEGEYADGTLGAWSVLWTIAEPGAP